MVATYLRSFQLMAFMRVLQTKISLLATSMDINFSLVIKTIKIGPFQSPKRPNKWPYLPTYLPLSGLDRLIYLKSSTCLEQDMAQMSRLVVPPAIYWVKTILRHIRQHFTSMGNFGKPKSWQLERPREPQ